MIVFALACAGGFKDVEKMRGMDDLTLEGMDEGADRKDAPLIFLKKAICMIKKKQQNVGSGGG